MSLPRWSAVLGIGALGLTLALAGCDSSSSNNKDKTNHTGQFGGLPIAGVAYQTESKSGVTDAQGRFEYRNGESVTFSIGALELGTAQADRRLSAVDLIGEAEDTSNTAVMNLAALLQSLDRDGDLNNGIQISAAATDIVSDYAESLVFDQSPADFASAGPMTDLFQALNTAGAEVFDSTDPRPRRLLDAQDAADTL